LSNGGMDWGILGLFNSCRFKFYFDNTFFNYLIFINKILDNEKSYSIK